MSGNGNEPLASTSLSFHPPAPPEDASDSDNDLEFEEVQNPELDVNAPTKRKPVEEGAEGQQGIEIVLDAGKQVTKKAKSK